MPDGRPSCRSTYSMAAINGRCPANAELLARNAAVLGAHSRHCISAVVTSRDARALGRFGYGLVRLDPVVGRTRVSSSSVGDLRCKHFLSAPPYPRVLRESDR